MSERAIDPLRLIQPRRAVLGISAILLPLDAAGTIDWPSFRAHVERTWAAGLTPAVNMDTGYVNLLSPDERLQVLRETRVIAAGRSFVAGAFVGDQPGARFNYDAYAQAIAAVTEHGGTPVVFQSFGLTAQGDDELIASYEALGKLCDRWIGFELGTMFAPFGRIYSLEVYRRLLAIKSCSGAKHSSLSRLQEWERIALRNAVRPDFHVFTGNDLAIDMVMYGSDYLLGLSTFAPDLFAKRDAYWAGGDPAFYELNDKLQYLGNLAFRAPTPAYKHSAAMFLQLRGWIATDKTHPGSPTRPASDRAILSELAQRMGITVRPE